MQESTVRRTLIVVLCLCGVVAMWVFADQASKHQSADEPPEHSAGSIKPASRTADPTAAHAGPSTGSGDNVRQTHTVSDHQAPPDVPGVHIISTTYNAITIGWDHVQDDGGVSFYQVTLNGIAAGETGGNQLTINWFNDDTSSHFVQVWAYDNAGNRSSHGTAVAVTRPTASRPSPPKRDWPTTSSPKKARSNNPGAGHRDPNSAAGRKDDPDQNKAARDQTTQDQTPRPHASEQSSHPSSPNPASQPAPQRSASPNQTSQRPTNPDRPAPSTPVPDARSNRPSPTDSATPPGSTSPTPTESAPTSPAPTDSSTTSPAPTGAAPESPSPTSTRSPTGSPGAEDNIVGSTPTTTPTDGSSTPSKLESPTGSPSPSVTPSR